MKGAIAIAGLAALVALSASGLFLSTTSSAHPGSGDVLLRVLHVVLLLSALFYTGFRYTLRRRTSLDELALLLSLACGVNFIVQLTGGSRSPWIGLYLLVGGLASVAFSQRHVVILTAAVISLETANGLLNPSGPAGDLAGPLLVFVAVVWGFTFMARVERDRADRAEDRLLRLDTGLKQLESTSETPSPLSEEGQRVGRAQYVRQLDQQLQPLLELARQATGSTTALLLQVDESGTSYWVRLVSGPHRQVTLRKQPVRGEILAEALRAEAAVCAASPFRPFPASWHVGEFRPQSVLLFPIRHWDEPPWVLVLEDEEPRPFDAARQELARSFGEQMAGVQSLFRRQATQHVEEQKLKRLLRVSERLSEALRVDEILTQIVSYAREVAAFDTCAVCLVDDGSETYRVAMAEGYPEQVLGLRCPDRVDHVGRQGPACQRGAAGDTYRQTFAYASAVPEGEARFVRGAVLAVPLRAQNRVCGALLLTRKGEPHSAQDVRLLRIHCNQAAVAIENALAYEKASKLAATDALTGLFNRRYLEEALTREISRAERAGSRLATLILDIDHFKGFNDTYGHAMGDVVLKKVANVLRSGLRKGDVLARFGGEEFVILLPGVSSRSALELAERIRASVESADVHPGGPRKHVTVSVGVSLFPDDGGHGEELLQKADEALYAAKETGRNRAVVYRAVDAAKVSKTKATRAEAVGAAT